MILTKFSIARYRSLFDISLDKFTSTTIFYGDNNAGKSNVLNALYTIFKRKRKISEELGKLTFTAPQNFYEGVVDRFSNNFYNNESNEISFSVEFSLRPEEIDLTKRFRSTLQVKPGSPNKIEFAGSLVSKEFGSDNVAEIRLHSAKLNNVLIYKFDKEKNELTYFPTLDRQKKDQGNLREAFARLVEPFNDCVALIESARDMLPTQFSVDEPKEEITTINFKNFLLSLYLSENGYELFERINKVFGSPPFSYGTVSFAKITGNLEVMIKDKGPRFPIKHIGSGVLQTLYIIARVIQSAGKIVCIEELEQNLSPKRQNLTLRKLQSMISDGSESTLQQLLISSHSSVYAQPKFGTIYFLEKANGKTIVQEMMDEKIKMKAGLKDHLIYAAMHPSTYSEKEWKEKIEEFDKLTNAGFDR